MRRPTRRWLVVLTLAAALAAGSFAVWPRPSQVTIEDVDRIHKGMTRAEVIAILGPPGDYRAGPTKSFFYVYGPLDTVDTDDEFLRMFETRDMPPDDRLDGWEWDTMIVRVRFDPTGYVRFSWARGSQPVEQGPLDNLLWRVKRQWRQWFR